MKSLEPTTTMSDKLCRWLNEELQLSRVVDPKNFAKDFSSGYLIGEVLHKYQLQNDFSMFMKKDTSISKVNNFTRLEPTLQLLGISFNINTAQDLIQEKEGVATRLLYQLYISLEKKKKAEISGTMMEIMQPAASASLHKKEHEIYSDRLHQVVRRDAEIKLEKISQHYGEKCQPLSERPVVNPPAQQKRKKVKDDKTRTSIDKSTYIQVPKPPPYTSQLSVKRRQQQHQRQLQLQRKERQAQVVHAEIAQFETNRKKLVTSGFTSSLSGHPFPPNYPFGGSNQGCEVPGGETKLKLQSNSKYIQEIRQRLEENAVAREQRDKRRDRFLVEQLKAHEAQEELRREEQLVKRLTRQTREEQRLAVQLLQIRMQKEVIRENRLFREQQHQQRRERDFREALDREAALALQARLDRSEEIRKELDLCQRIAAERAQSRRQKHFKSCKDILEQIVDLATKMGEYRLVTGNLIPEKQMREWKELLFGGLPLYEPVTGPRPKSASLDPTELKKQEILNNQDYDEYSDMVGEWAWPEDAEEMNLPLTNNNVLGHVVHRLRNMLHPPVTQRSSPSFPPFTIKACVLGKHCAGKASCISAIAEALGISVLSADMLLQDALTAYKSREEVTEKRGGKSDQQLLSSNTSLKSDPGTEAENKPSDAKLSTRAVQGEAAEKELRRGNTISDELLVEIIMEAIRQVPAHSGWILLGFPSDVTQAHLLEKALGGTVDVEKTVVTSRTNLAADPNPPAPPPPPAPVLDLALLLNSSDEHVITQALSHSDTEPAAAAAAASSQTMDKNLCLAQILYRIADFQDTWPELEEWFGGKQNILVHVDADVNDEDFCSRVDSVLQQVMQKTQSLNEAKAQSGASKSPASPHTPRENLGLSKSASISSVAKDDSQTLTKSNPGSASSTSSSTKTTPSQLYVDQPLLPEVPKYLCPFWDAVCDCYVNGVKAVMAQLRSQRTLATHHLFNIREGFKRYLGRPDLKQELVCQWQKDFNSMNEDMRDEEDTRAELHMRFDELRERLWDISDKRKEDDEQERSSLMCDGWLEDHTAMIINHHCVLIQLELNRFQETLHLLRVYYLGMTRQTLPEPPSQFFSISLLETPGTKEQDDSHPTSTSVFNQMEDGEETSRIKLAPLLRYPESRRKSSASKNQETEPVKPQEKLVSDCENVINTISTLVSAEVHQRETKEQKESVQEEEEEEKAKDKRASASANRKRKDKQAPNKKKGPSSPPPATSPAPAEDKTQEKTHDQAIREKIHKEYVDALHHEENAAKVRIALVKGHGLLMVEPLQSRAQESFSSMQEWLEGHYLAEMKSIDQLAEVIGHHIEAGTKVQNELVLERSDFYVNADCHMVPSPAAPPPPPPLEKPSLSTPTIAQLQSLFRQLSEKAPSGDDSVRSGVETPKKNFPESWINMTETQTTEIVSLLTDGHKLIDWRRFLLSAALPWPFPTVTQLLDVLKHFRKADSDHSGLINEEQYLQTELWFGTQSVPEDPSHPVPYDRLGNLRKFFFQLFADSSVSPPLLDYVSMLQYFAADSNPRLGFHRALSVVLGQHLRHSSPGHLVKSMPSIEEASELMSFGLNGDDNEENTLGTSRCSKGEQEVSISALLTVICHKGTKIKDSSLHPPDCLSQEQLTEFFKELGCEAEECVPFSILSQHPFYQVLLDTSTQHQLVNIHRVFLAQQDEGEASTLTVS